MISGISSLVDINLKNKKRSRTAALQENNVSVAKSPSQNKSVKRRDVASLFSKYTEDEEEETVQYQAPKRLALQDTNISRYRREFVEIELIGKLARFFKRIAQWKPFPMTVRFTERMKSILIFSGSGEFGKVFRCKNRLDGTEYAVKKSKRPVAGSSYE